MPTYEYECLKCGYRFEKFQSIKDKPIKKCPKCGGRTRRIIGAGAGIIFKGKGFYHTDYKMKADKKWEDKGDEKEDTDIDSKEK